ncbi:MAG: hypothetical protein ACFE9I_16410 [Candidatus Hermodarchaeota archaeon]
MDKFENEKKKICKEIEVFITKAAEENEMNIVKKLIYLKKIIFTNETHLEFITEHLEENVINIRIRKY